MTSNKSNFTYMKKSIVALSLVLLFASCKKEERAKTDADFENYKKNFVDNLWKLNPGWASNVGFHKNNLIR